VHFLHAATGPALAVPAVIVAGGIVFWFARRGKRQAAAGFAEAACPACLAVAFLAERPSGLQSLTHDAEAQPQQTVAAGHGPSGPPPATAD
jgi:hypothetical protein